MQQLPIPQDNQFRDPNSNANLVVNPIQEQVVVQNNQNQMVINNENNDPNLQKPLQSEPNGLILDNSLAKNKMQLLQSTNIVSLQRSYQFTNNDRYQQEQQYLLPLKSGGGLLGLQRIFLDEKINLLSLDKTKTLRDNQILEKLRIDGIYVDDPQVRQKFTDINVQKLEERLLREKKTNYFRLNGELELHNDLLADEITRPADLAFEQSEAFQLKVQNSILSNRMHSFKKRYYRLDIVVGKISLLSYHAFFSTEDRLAIQLKEIYKNYEKQTSLAMIPFYLDRLKFIEQQQYEKQRNPQTTKEDLDFLQQNRDETQRKYDQEKREVQELATQIYSKWKQIKELRKSNGYASTNVKLQVHKNQEREEFYFNLMHEEPSGKKFNGSALPGSEISRRNNAMKIRAYVRLIINGKYVTRTRKAFLKWPNFEIELMEQFQVHVFTMPSSIQLEIVIGTFKEYLVDVIDVEVPGQYVKALTSASSLIKDITFSKFEYDKKKLAKKKLTQSKKQDSILSESQKKQLEEQQKQQDITNEKIKLSDINGIIYLKSEWKGEGPDMPPMRSENIFNMALVSKHRKQYTEEEQYRMILRQLYIDVNDPRNEQIIRFIKETKNEFLIQMLMEDARNPLSRLEPFRHQLLEARQKDPIFNKMPIPILEKEIIDASKNKFFLDQLEILFREQAYKVYLEQRAVQDKESKAERDPRALQLAEFLSFDPESIRRRQKFFALIKQKQKEIKAGYQKTQTQYKSVIREFELFEAQNPLVALFNKIFISGRKLRPVIKKRQPVALDTAKEAKILVHVIKGYHVPVRSQVFKQITQLKQMSQVANPFARGMPGPTARTPQNLLMQAQYPGMAMGATGQIDMMRQSYPGSMGTNNFGMISGQGGFSGTNFMMGPGLNPNMMRTVGGGIDELNRRAMANLKVKDCYNISRVETFVEVRIVYNDLFTMVSCTNIAEGDFPEWNDVLTFPLMAENGRRFTKEELINSKSIIYVSLFDQEVQRYREDEYNQAAFKTTIEYRFLGSFSIPLTSILNNSPKMEAMFKVNRPLALFNYVMIRDNIFLMDEHDQQIQEQRTNEELNTYISLSISLDPVLEIPTENESDYYPLGNSNLLLALSDWTKRFKMNKQFENREIKCIGENSQGQHVLLSMFLTEQIPPKDVCDLESYQNDEFAIEKVARYVSLIPFIDDNQAFVEMPDLFCTSQEFLDLGAGGYEEHAILLCNYFNYIDRIQHNGKIKSYVVLGKGTPEGKTAYVLRRDVETNHVELWNPMKGEAYFFGRKELIDQVGCISIAKGYSMDIRLNDPTCQLKSIGCIIGPDNVWANVQSVDDPALLNYNLDNAKNWQSFFNKQNFTKYFPEGQILPIQPSLINYSDPQLNNEELAIRIQKYISQRFQDERIKEVKMTTKWNVAVGDKLINILFHCEMHKLKARQGATNSTLRTDSRRNASEDLDVSAISEKIRKATEDDAHGKKAWGFPINVTFVTLELLWEEVKNTKLHTIMDRNAEFSLSVYVKSYSSNVLSIWLYLAVFTKQRLES